MYMTDGFSTREDAKEIYLTPKRSEFSTRGVGKELYLTPKELNLCCASFGMLILCFVLVLCFRSELLSATLIHNIKFYLRIRLIRILSHPPCPRPHKLFLALLIYRDIRPR